MEKILTEKKDNWRKNYWKALYCVLTLLVGAIVGIILRYTVSIDAAIVCIPIILLIELIIYDI